MNSVTVATVCGHLHGTLRHAFSLAAALAEIVPECRVVDVPVASTGRAWKVGARDGRLVEERGESIPPADLTLIVGLSHPACARAAQELAADNCHFVLVPTGYEDTSCVSTLPRPADALWYVSWDQALAARQFWSLAARVDVLPCAVDTTVFRPARRASRGHPWVLCRHSRDSLEKFSPDLFRVLRCLTDQFDVIFRILGGTLTLGESPGSGISVYPENTFNPEEFLREADLWVYSHASFWKETACIAMLEAMASGLPVIVSGVGGMREYLVHGVTGFACADMEETINAVRLLLGRPDVRLTMSRSARNHATKHFSLSAMRKRLQILLEKLALDG